METKRIDRENDKEREVLFCERWLADGIEDDYRDWLPFGVVRRRKASRIFIESPTGTGKSTLILDRVFRFVAENGYNILYLANRSVLKQQVRNAAARKWRQRGIARKDEASFYYPDSFCYITILSYQAMPLNREALAGLLSDYAYIVLDEAHFFIEDALFNAKTGRILEEILNTARNSALIFLSATMDGSEALLRKAVREIQPSNEVDDTLNELAIRKHCVVYRNAYQNAVYKPLFFRDYDELLPAIRRTVGEKWLIFASSIQKGQAMQQRIKRETGRKTMFLSSKNKSGRGWEKLAVEERFEQEILITTKVLDNGVNILDKSVKHVVIPFCDQTEFVQMLGRRRAEKGESICLYVEVPTIQKINTLKHGVEIKRRAIHRVKNCLPEKRNTLLGEMWEAGRKDINSLFYVDVSSGKLVANELAVIKLKQLSDFYGMLAAHYKEGACYEKTVLQWIKMEGSELHYIGQVLADDMQGFLAHYVGVRILQPEWEGVYRKFEQMYEQECRKRFSTDSEEYQEAFSIRKAPSRRKSTINHQIQMLGLPYELKKEKNGWIVYRK